MRRTREVRQRLSSLVPAALLLMVAACDEDDATIHSCETGDAVVSSGYAFCVVEQSVVVETGFICPDDMPYSYEGENVVACSDSDEVPEEVVTEIDMEFGPSGDEPVGEEGEAGEGGDGEEERENSSRDDPPRRDDPPGGGSSDD